MTTTAVAAVIPGVPPRKALATPTLLSGGQSGFSEVRRIKTGNEEGSQGRRAKKKQIGRRQQYVGEVDDIRTVCSTATFCRTNEVGSGAQVQYVRSAYYRLEQ